MASLGHLAVGIATARAFTPPGAPRRSLAKAALVFAALSMLPDADVVAFALRIPYEHPFGHRGAAHSLAFALLCTAAAWALAKPLGLKPRATALATLVAVGTHPLLDTLTDGGLGCALLWPFTSERYFAPLRPILVAPIGLGMLSLRGLTVVAFELALFSPLLVYAAVRRWGPAAVVATAALLAGTGFARASLRAAERPDPSPDAVVTVRRDGASVERLEAEVAEPLERALHARRLRTRIGGGAVRVEVWGAVEAPPPGATLERVADPYWLVRGERPANALCGSEPEAVHVHIDPLKLAALNVGALDVVAKVRALPPEELLEVELSEGVRLADVAGVEVRAPAPRCAVEAEDGPAWVVHGPEPAGATRLSSRIVLSPTGPLALTTLKPAAVTREAPSRVTLWFTEPYEPAKALAELRGHDVRHLDGVRRVRLVVKGSAAEPVAASIAAGLRARLVVRPAAAEARVEAKVDADRARRLGIRVEDVEALAELALRGRELDGVRVSIDLGEREHLAALFIGPQRLGELVSISEALEAEVFRENGERAIELVAYGLEKRDVPRFTLPPGVSVEYYGEW